MSDDTKETLVSGSVQNQVVTEEEEIKVDNTSSTKDVEIHTLEEWDVIIDKEIVEYKNNINNNINTSNNNTYNYQCTNNLTWDDIPFIDEDEKNGCLQFYHSLLKSDNKNKYQLVENDCPPFEVCRYFIGSKNRIKKAYKKWHLTIDICKKHKLMDVNEQQIRNCFKKMYKSMRFGGYDNSGAKIFAMKYEYWLPSEFENFDILMKAFLFLLHTMTEDLDICRTGITFVADCKNFGWDNFSLEMEKVFVNLIQEAYPMRLKAMYMVDAPILIKLVMKIMKPFLSTKMQERIFICDRNELFEHLDVSQIPGLIGGEYDDERMCAFYPQCVRFALRSNLEYMCNTTVVE